LIRFAVPLFSGGFRCRFSNFLGCRFSNFLGCLSNFLGHFLNGRFDHFCLLRWLRPTGEYGIHCRWFFIPIAVATPTSTAIAAAFARATIAPIVIATIAAGRFATAGFRRGIDPIGFLNGLLNHDSTILNGLMILH
jgi:hypothetical protein